METTPVVDQSKLVAYTRPEKEPMSEKTLRALSSFSGLLAIIAAAFGVAAVLFSIVQGTVQFTWYNGSFVPLVPWHFMLTLVVISFGSMVILGSFEGHFGDQVRRYHTHVPQGMIVKMDTRGGGDYSLRWVLLVEGFNGLNQRRIQAHTVDAGSWYDKYEVGDYVDFRDDEDKENSMSTPLREAYVGAEM